MAENVNGSDIFGSGNHQWQWNNPAVFEKKLATAGTTGEVGIRTHVGSAPVRIIGLLKAADNAAMDVLEQVIEGLVAARTPCTWEDDQAPTGLVLVLTQYQRLGGRKYGLQGATPTVWQDYIVLAEERHAGPFV